jgi:ABC-type uncharacterized transport system auxiliary subunit
MSINPTDLLIKPVGLQALDSRSAHTWLKSNRAILNFLPLPMRFLLPALVLFMLFFTSACGLSRPYPTIRSFALDITDNNIIATKIKHPFLVQVTSSGAAPQYETRKMVYKIGQNEFSEDFYNELVGLPSRLVADQLAAYLDKNSTKFRTSQGVYSQNPDLGLDIYLISFHGDYTKNPPQAVVEVKVTLTDQRRSRARTIMSKSYINQNIIPDNNDRSAQLAFGLGQALTPILEAIMNDLDQSIKGR